ncbi:MAG: VOC family protein [Phenylobacterium sp.]|nr:MAG: VOC family protein [Phenylobacterium sp.]
MSEDWSLDRFYHTIINAKDIDETVKFYQDLGFVILSDRRNMKWPPGGMAIFGMTPDAKGKGGTLMGLPGHMPPEGPMLDIFEWTVPEASFPEPSLNTVPRVLAFRTTNVAGAMKALQAKGYKTTAPEPNTSFAAAGILSVGCVYDPNGNIVLMSQLEPGLAYSRSKEVNGVEEK